MAGGGEAFTTRQKNFYVRIKVPLIGEFQQRMSKSYDDKEANVAPCIQRIRSKEFESQPDPVLYTVIVLKLCEKLNKKIFNLKSKNRNFVSSFVQVLTNFQKFCFFFCPGPNQFSGKVLNV